MVSNLADLAHVPVAAFAEQLLGISRDAISRRIRTFNAEIADAVNRHGQILVDLYEDTNERLPHHPEFFCAGGFHPSAAGYQAWADSLWPGIQQALERATTPLDPS